MTRRRSSAPGRDRPDRRRSALLVSAAAFLLATFVAACGATADGTPTRTDTADASTGATDPSATALPGSTPTDLPDPGPTELPPSEAPITEAPSASADAGSAAACSGTPENRDFFAAVADAVSWPVYCPVLPDGWFVDAGQYRLAGGAWVEVGFRGPGGARLDLREGAICTGDDCAPEGTDLGAADFGDLSGTLRDLGGGRYAVVVDPGASPSWSLVATGLSEADARSVAAELALVGG